MFPFPYSITFGYICLLYQPWSFMLTRKLFLTFILSWEKRPFLEICDGWNYLRKETSLSFSRDLMMDVMWWSMGVMLQSTNSFLEVSLHGFCIPLFIPGKDCSQRRHCYLLIYQKASYWNLPKEQFLIRHSWLHPISKVVIRCPLISIDFREAALKILALRRKKEIPLHQSKLVSTKQSWQRDGWTI